MKFCALVRFLFAGPWQSWQLIWNGFSSAHWILWTSMKLALFSFLKIRSYEFHVKFHLKNWYHTHCYIRFSYKMYCWSPLKLWCLQWVFLSFPVSITPAPSSHTQIGEYPKLLKAMSTLAKSGYQLNNVVSCPWTQVSRDWSSIYR